MAGTRRLKSLADSMRDRLRLPAGDLVVALSGGADSAALAYLVGDTVRAVHVHHGLPGSDLMLEATQTIAGRLGVPLDVVSMDVPPGSSPEGQARSVRYRALMAATAPGESILTAHTRDDSVETTLLNLMRGTGVGGLVGIPQFRSPNIYRPMLGIERSETRELATLAGLPFHDDPMNQDLTLSRNYLRAAIMPMMRSLNPRLVDAIDRASSLVVRQSAMVESLASVVRPTFTDVSVSVPIGALLAVPGPVADEVLRSMLAHLEPGILEEKLMARVWAVVRGEAAREQLSRGLVVSTSGPLLVIGRDQEPASPVRLSIRVGQTITPTLEYELTVFDDVCRVAPLSNWAALFSPQTELTVATDGLVYADGRLAWAPGRRRYPVAWYEPGTRGYLSVFAREVVTWT